ncbi:MAG TPA: hypothetical protein VKE69_08775 [Planctomycetota bacterium]|nr:hypothetical protein [Planctomycetota bacterium]
MTEPIEGRPSAFVWNAGGWFGAQIGSTFWIGFAAVLVALRSPAAAIVPAIAFLGANAIGLRIWRSRSRLRPIAGMGILLLVVAVASAAAILAIDRAGLFEEIQMGGSAVSARTALGVLAAMVVGLVALGGLLESRARRAASAAQRDEPRP